MKSSNRVVKYGKFYERKNQYDEVIFQDGSDDLPPSVSEGALHIDRYERKDNSYENFSNRCCRLYWV